MKQKEKKVFRISISIQISIFLVVVAFVPVAIMMALKTYESQLLTMLENSNVQQGRLVAAALEGFATLQSGELSKKDATLLLENMEGHFDSRIRVLDKNGKLLADSATLEPTLQENSALDGKKSISQESFSYSKESTGGKNTEEANLSSDQSFLYKIFSFPIRAYRKFFRPPVSDLYDTADYYSQKDIYDGEEIQAALQGNYGATTRVSSGNQVSVTLYSALPIFSEKKDVVGIVLVNRSTYRILQNLYDLRLDLAKIFLRSLIVVALIALFLTLRISLPLKKLSKQTCDCADKKGRILFTSFIGKKRKDEIGELSRSFSSLIERLNKRINFSQAFAADISHEFKNPLTAIRSSAELLGTSELSNIDRKELSLAIVEEVEQLQNLITEVKNISRIDSGQDLMEEETKELPVNLYISNLVSHLQKKHENVEIKTSLYNQEIMLAIPENYLYRICDNLINNAVSFGKKILVSTKIISFTEQKNNVKKLAIVVEDDGPGIRDEAKEKIFHRFYSERPSFQNDSVQDKGHMGLGLSIVKAIVDSLEGEISVAQSASLGGASFSVIIPIENNK